VNLKIEKMKHAFKVLFLVLFIIGCSKNKGKNIDKTGIQVSEISEDDNGKKVVGLNIDSLKLETRPKSVLLTKNPQHRLTPVYKVNYNKKNVPYTGSVGYHRNWHDESEEGRHNWNYNFMPGFEAIYGYNFVNVSHYNNETRIENKLFDDPVLINTLYFPAASKDTLNYQPVARNFYMVSVYDEDTNKDGYINTKDLRRFYHFDIHGVKVKTIVPEKYSVMSSEYDSEIDFMYIFAKEDVNKNGQMEANEPVDIFWIDLNNPENFGQHYKTE